MAETQTSINIPQLIAVAIVGFLALRWFLNKPSTPSPHSSSSSRTNSNNRIDVQKVDQVSAMFPQLDRRTIAWDLSRNGGSVAATTERILSSRGLDNPPPSFRPDLPPPATAAAQQRNARGQGLSAPSQPDLITRYNLQARVGGKGKEPVPSEEQRRSGSSWSSDKSARAESLKKRREEMVLEARRRMEAKDRGEA
jgi:coupling of ubiquitin conjugation to ER degradation protein 1